MRCNRCISQHLACAVCGDDCGNDYRLHHRNGTGIHQSHAEQPCRCNRYYQKVGYIVAVAVGIVADYLISSALVNCGIDLRINYCIGMIVTIWFIINELISILENLSEIGIPLPKFLVSIVKRLKTTVEVKTDESEE